MIYIPVHNAVLVRNRALSNVLVLWKVKMALKCHKLTLKNVLNVGRALSRVTRFLCQERKERHFLLMRHGLMKNE